MTFCTYFRRSPTFLFACLLSFLTADQVFAHARWVVPSHTIISGDQATAVTLDYSISNGIFHPDIALGGMPLGDNKAATSSTTVPPQLASTKAVLTQPNGEQQVLKSVDLGRKSSTYFTASDNGTYRVDLEQPPIDVILFTAADGSAGRLFGTPDAVARKLPEGAQQVEWITYLNRVQAFVTRNQVTQKTLHPSGSGLELKHFTHPNELFANEPVRYQMLLNGKVLVPNSDKTHLKITAAGTRYRNQRGSFTPPINETGEFVVRWPDAGLYLIEVEHELKGPEGTKMYALFLTLEIQPE